MMKVPIETEKMSVAKKKIITEVQNIFPIYFSQ